MRLVISLLLACALAASGSTYYVTKSGVDAAAGTQAAPWLTVQKAATTMVAGDTVIISSGDYNEYVVSAANGTSGNPITFQANATNGSPVVIRQFRAKHRFQTLSGLHLSKASDSTGASAGNNSLIYVDAPGGSNNGSDLVVTNCFLRDLPYVISTNASFGSNYVHVTDKDFNAVGFTNGSLVSLWADSLQLFTNHGVARTVLSNSADGLTMFFTTSLSADSGTNYWAVIAPGSDNSTYKGLQAPVGSGLGASNLFIVNNTFSNLFGPAVIVSGNSNRIIGNKFTKNNGQYFLQVQSPNSQVISNLFIDNPNIEFWTQAELNDALHPLGGTYYDWQCNVIASYAHFVTNVLFAYNWIQNCDNQLMQIQSPDSGANDSYGFIMRSNVFVGMMQHGSFSRSDLTIDHNTFYRTAYNIDETLPLGMGGVGGLTQTNPVLTYNVFFDNGEHAGTNNETPYTITAYTNATIGSNYSVFPETLAFLPTPTAAGVLTNYGDPLFADARNPLGPDGLPFTADDGLRPLPNSPLAALGLGALPPLPSTSPIAHFKVLLSSYGWKDATGTNYDTAWGALKPHQRSTVIRPYNTPEALGNIPLRVTFDATGSIDGLGTNRSTIIYYGWNFGDGASSITPQPYATHTYTTTGAVTVSLWITNLYGSTASFTNAYRLLASAGGVIRYVGTNGNDSTGDGLTTGTAWRTIQKAATSASAGWTVSVGPGSYGETVDCTVDASSGSRIAFVSRGARTTGFNLRKADYTVEGFELDASGLASSGALYLYAVANRVWLFNNYLHNFTNKYGVEVNIGAGTHPQDGPTGCVLSNNLFSGIYGPNVVIKGSNFLATANIIRNTLSEGDAFRVWGAGHTISYNYCTNLSAYGGGGHADFIQSFGDYLEDFNNSVIEGNVIHGNDVQPCMFEHDSSGSGNFTANYTNIIFRNNIFANVQYAANVDVDGTKWYNNLFYRVNTGNGSHVFALGGTKGSAYGTEMTNNAFVACGNGNNNGWWQIPGDIAGITNFSVLADYNFITKTNYGAYASPPTQAHGVNGGDPQFTSVASLDFRIATNSAMAGVGKTLASFSTTLDGQTRSNPWDIGPYAVAATSGGGGGGGDVTAPTCAITSPTNNQPSVATSIAISGTSSDDAAVASVTLTNVSTATGFTVTGTTSWSATATLAYGSNYLRAIATDSSGNKATNAIAVLSVNDTNTWASTRSPYLGVQYLQTQNPAAQHTLMSNVPATYVNLPITYAILTGGAYGGYGNGTNYYDATYALNTNNGWRVILQFSDMPTNKILDYLPYLTNRYRCWMVIPINENDDATVSSETIKYYRAVMPNMRLGGPALYHLKNPTYIDALVASGAFAMLDSFVGHDYLAVPLNGACTAGWWTNSYYHPIEAPTDYHPEWSVGNLAARLAWMNSYTNLLRTNYTDTPKVMVTEYGIYQNNPEDGLYAGQIFRNMQILAFVTANLAATNQCPYNNALYDGAGAGYFTPSQQNFLKRIAPLSRGLGTVTTDNLVIQ